MQQQQEINNLQLQNIQKQNLINNMKQEQQKNQGIEYQKIRKELQKK